MKNIKYMRMGNVLNSKNEIIGTLDRMKFVDADRIYYDLNTRSVGIAFESIKELDEYLEKYSYRWV